MKRALLALFLIFTFTPISFADATTPIKILLIPGHDNEVWGAQYGHTKEADMNLRLATELFDILKKDKRFEVHLTRNKDEYTKEFRDYFSLHQDEISAFKEKAKKEMQNKITSGAFIQKENAPHNKVSEDIAIRLYGFNKWANENKIDAMIHIHFNDYPRQNKWTLGKYKGFAIYIPEGQLSNSKESARLASNIFFQLKKKYVTSTYEKELGGLIPDQTLIALGSNDSLLPSVRSVLIEYGYIYRFQTKKTREGAYKNMAKLTAAGIKNYFFRK